MVFEHSARDRKRGYGDFSLLSRNRVTVDSIEDLFSVVNPVGVLSSTVGLTRLQLDEVGRARLAGPPSTGAAIAMDGGMAVLSTECRDLYVDKPETNGDSNQIRKPIIIEHGLSLSNVLRKQAVVEAGR